MSDTTEKLITDYEAIRQRQQDLITDLLDVLPRIDNLDESRLTQVRDALFHADHPFLMVFVGAFNTGKSSLINALLGSDEVLRIGATPTTDRINILRWGEEARQMDAAGGVNTVFYPSPLLRKVSLVDTPGLESVFQDHESTTRNFLHRCDTVVFVMLASQAMTAANLDTLRMFREYGKKILIVINQADLLSEDEQKQVRQYVLDQSKDKLGLAPEVWLVSAKQGMAARQGGGLDEALWAQSGLGKFEAYIEKQLSDAERMRVKLQTPLQIVQTAHQSALQTVQANQRTLDQYRSTRDNIEQQLTVQQNDLRQKVRVINGEIEAQFQPVIQQSQTALNDVFALGHGLGNLGRGLLELVGLGRLLKNRKTGTPTQRAFAEHGVWQPLESVPSLAEKLPPRLEAQDMQDLDSLVKYGQREVNALNPQLRAKLIGTIQAPSRYDRSFMQGLQASIEARLSDLQASELERLDKQRSAAFVYFAAWEMLLLILLIALFATRGALNYEADVPVSLILYVLIGVGMLAGFVLLPVRGRILHASHKKQLLETQEAIKKQLSEAADKQINYSMSLRREAVSPLTRFIDAQVALQQEQFTRLKNAEQSITKLETDVSALGKRRILGFNV